MDSKCYGEITALKPDMVDLQGIDTDSTRSYHLDEVRRIEKRFSEGGWQVFDVFAVIGSIKSGLLAMADYEIKDTLRRFLPIETGPVKIVDTALPCVREGDNESVCRSDY